MEWSEVAIAIISGGALGQALRWLRARLGVPKIVAQANQIEDASRTASWEALFDAANEQTAGARVIIADRERVIAERDARILELTKATTVELQHRLECQTQLAILQTKFERQGRDLEQLAATTREQGLQIAEYKGRAKAAGGLKRRPVRSDSPTPLGGTSTTPVAPASSSDTPPPPQASSSDITTGDLKGEGEGTEP